ncbi:1-aminocyclopropane-1-carboxylate deaminase/D-cysteine desulfhydrase [Robiginitalea sp. IMCC43444]|uniref:1-aminocyclopropane-1-carboxylate deaminase/D-cysteine desulfhydrase n=1 Tax=Robiginitalea sp. IMCC43444 TaxID=3459121 RepID=UPI0040437D87
MKSVTQQLRLPLLERNKVELYVKREDLLFPELSGNKYRKLKYNLERAADRGYKTLLTFGGAFSNHIHATAAAGKLFGFKTIGLIRGEELAGKPLNPTLQAACDNGMQLVFLSREAYRQKTDPAFLEKIKSDYKNPYILPEGGTNEAAIAGCSEIISSEDYQYHYICCSVGTGGTLAGLASAAAPNQTVLGFPALKAEGLSKELSGFIPSNNWALADNYHFGGYGKINRELIDFINRFYKETGIALDPVYTGKLFYGILEEVGVGGFKAGSKILAIHSGGLQGIDGMNLKLRKKNLPLLQV